MQNGKGKKHTVTNERHSRAEYELLQIISYTLSLSQQCVMIYMGCLVLNMILLDIWDGGDPFASLPAAQPSSRLLPCECGPGWGCGFVSPFPPILPYFRAKLRSIKSDSAWRDVGRVDSIDSPIPSLCRLPQPARAPL